MDGGTSRKAVRVRNFFKADLGSGSVSTMRTITTFPNALVYRFNATNGKSDHNVLAAQYSNTTRSGTFRRMASPVRCARAPRTKSPTVMRPLGIARSIGLPSRYWSADWVKAEAPSHTETWREPPRTSQAIGSHSAIDVWALR